MVGVVVLLSICFSNFSVISLSLHMSICIAKLIDALTKGENLVPMILLETFQGLDAFSKKKTHLFHGSLWAQAPATSGFLVGMTDLYQSMCLEFRYGDGKVLGTQPHPTRRLAFTHCVPYPNPIKESSNRLFYTHTYTKPTLTCI